DTLTGISRALLGYRLGTIINWLVLVWAAQVTNKILRPYARAAGLRDVCVLAVFLAEHLLFEVSTYMVDLLALPLLLEATYLTLRISRTDIPVCPSSKTVGAALCVRPVAGPTHRSAPTKPEDRQGCLSYRASFCQV